MSEMPRLHPVTRIRGELSPTPAVKRAVNRFLEHPMDEDAIRLYTTAQTVVDQGAYRRHQYDTIVPKIEPNSRNVRMRALAQRVFALAGPLKILERPDGGGRLFFNVRADDQEDLHRAGEMLRAIRGLETPDPEDLLYVEFARGALAKDLGKRREQIHSGYASIAAELRHPTAKARMTASGLHVVTRDMSYALKDDQSLPLAE
jgi:hypothetical protein